MNGLSAVDLSPQQRMVLLIHLKWTVRSTRHIKPSSAKRRRPFVCRAPTNIGILTVMIVKAVHAMFRRLGRLAGLTCAGWLVACAPTPQPLPVDEGEPVRKPNGEPPEEHPPVPPTGPPYEIPPAPPPSS